MFRARFVDFVGVEEFDDSEIGRIPCGWRAGALTDLARFVNGKAFTKHANGAGRPGAAAAVDARAQGPRLGAERRVPIL